MNTAFGFATTIRKAAFANRLERVQVTGLSIDEVKSPETGAILRIVKMAALLTSFFGDRGGPVKPTREGRSSTVVFGLKARI
jgi:hypothetical protein